MELFKKIMNMPKMRKEVIARRVKLMEDLRTQYIESGEVVRMHVRLQKGNDKTGANCYTVSLVPILDCGKNCKHCSDYCYDVRNVCWKSSVMRDRARNSAIHLTDRARYWREIEEQIFKLCATEVRLNVGGDLDALDFYYLKKVAAHCPRTMFLFFTKSIEEINAFLDENKFTDNVKAMLSYDNQMESFENKHNIPVAYIRDKDGYTDAPKDAEECNGNCSRCAFVGNGCWYLKKGGSVVFDAH